MWININEMILILMCVLMINEINEIIMNNNDNENDNINDDNNY